MSYKSKFTGVEVERRLDLVIDVQNELQRQQTEIESKQDIVTDLQDIREGAAKGAAALFGLNQKQDVISDLDDIRIGSQLGQTALQSVPAADSQLGLVQSGGDVTISNGIITVKDDSHNHVISNIDNLQTTLDQKVPKTTTINGKSLSENITLTASDLGIDINDATDATLVAAKQYTDNKVAALVNGAPETLDTLDELAAALQDNDEIVDVLTDAIGKKQDIISDLSTIRSGANKGATAVQPSAISDMETKTNAAATYQLKITDNNKLDYDLINGVPTLLSQFTDDVVSGKYLPLSGGKLSTSRTVLTINREGTGSPLIYFSQNDVRFGAIGFFSTDSLEMWSFQDSKYYKIWNAKNLTPTEILTQLKTVDGEGSGLDADTLDGTEKSELFTLLETSTTYISMTIGGVNRTIMPPALIYYRYVSEVASSSTTPTAKFPGTKFGTRNGLYLTGGYSYDTSILPKRYGNIINIIGDGGGQLFAEWTSDYTTGHLYYRSHRDYLANGGWTPWKTVAFIDDNVATATKLQTPRTIWGQSFDGSANVTGDLTVGDGNLILNNNKELQWKNTNGENVSIITYSNNNSLVIGTGVAKESRSLYIRGLNVYLQYGTNHTPGLYLKNTGNVLIGTTTDSGYKLDVNGSIHTNSRLLVDTIPIYKSQDDVLYIDGNVNVYGLYVTNPADSVQHQVYHEGNLSNVSQLINDANYVSATDTDDTEVDDIEAVYVTETLLESELEKKQDKLISGTNIRTVNGTSILGSGNIEIKNNNEDILNLVYPIGSIYLSVNEVNPSTLFGFGEWEMIKDTFLLGAGDTYQAGSTGGSATHTLTVNEMPEHQHVFPRQQWFGSDTVVEGANQGYLYSWKTTAGGATSYGFVGEPGTYGPAGYSAPHNNMPPYLTVYIWKRIS